MVKKVLHKNSVISECDWVIAQMPQGKELSVVSVCHVLTHIDLEVSIC